MANTSHGLKIADSWYPSLNDNSIHLIKLVVLLYNDDIIVLNENEHQLQTVLDTVHEYSTRYNLSTYLSSNINKTLSYIFAIL